MLTAGAGNSERFIFSSRIALGGGFGGLLAIQNTPAFIGKDVILTRVRGSALATRASHPCRSILCRSG